MSVTDNGLIVLPKHCPECGAVPRTEYSPARQIMTITCNCGMMNEEVDFSLVIQDLHKRGPQLCKEARADRYRRFRKSKEREAYD